jgi:hypothetical protein
MSRAAEIDATINTLAARTESVVHARDLRRHGISRDCVGTRLRRGWMAPLVGRTYAVGPFASDPTDAMLRMSGQLHAGAGSMLVGETAATVLGAWDRGAPAVQVASQHWLRAARGYEFVRTQRPSPPRSIRCGAFEVLDPCDLCLDLAGRLTRWQLAHVIVELRYRRMMDVAALEQLARERAGHPWVATLRDAIALVRSNCAGTRTRSEDRLLELILDAGLPEPIVNTRGVMGLPNDEPDLVLMEALLNIECDGDQHLEPWQVELDDQRDAMVHRRGWRVLRIWWNDVWRRPRYVVGLIARMIDEGPLPIGHLGEWTVRSSGLVVSR